MSQLVAIGFALRKALRFIHRGRASIRESTGEGIKFLSPECLGCPTDGYRIAVTTNENTRVPKDFERNVRESIALVHEYASKEMLELRLGDRIGASPDLFAFPRAIYRFFRKFSEKYKRERELHKQIGLDLSNALEVLDKSVVDNRNNISWFSLAPGAEVTPKPELKLKSSVLKALCPALQSVASDAFEIAKISTPILLSLSLAGTIAMPTSPLAFGLLAVLVSKAGIASVCRNFNSSKK